MDLSTFSSSLKTIARESRKGKILIGCIEAACAQTTDPEVRGIWMEVIRNLQNGRDLISAMQESDIPYQALEFFREMEEHGFQFDTPTFFETFAERMEPDWAVTSHEII